MALDVKAGRGKPGVLARYETLLPLTAVTPRITLGEGNTPLVRSARLEALIGCKALYFKLEGCNPTGSFKDRGMVMAIAKAMEAGSKAVICASTGNTSASAAAYAAAAGLRAVVLVPEGQIALGKLAQARMYGAKVLLVAGNFDEALRLVRHVGEKHPVTVVNSINPFRLEGQKTAAFEICDVLGDAPDFLAIPVGNAGNISAYWRGFKEYRAAQYSRSLPRMLGFEAEGAAPIVRNAVVEHPETVATAIRIGNPANWRGALEARDESGGLMAAVTDSEILHAYRALATKEGLFVEPASAASVAGLLRLARQGTVDFSQYIIASVLTGSGLKDPDTALDQAPEVVRVAADLASVEEALQLSG